MNSLPEVAVRAGRGSRAAGNPATAPSSAAPRSETEIKNVLVNQSNIAIAAKDSTEVKINKSQIFNSLICFSAYRKKQEFSGAKIEINDTNRNKDNFYTQKGSKIIFNL